MTKLLSRGGLQRTFLR